MKRITRFSIAIVLMGILALTASGVWASQKFKGTVPALPSSGSGNCPHTIDMGTALFTPLADNCTMSVDLIGNDTGEYADPPEDLACVSDTFEVSIDPLTVLVRVCYAYPPELAEKEAKIYKLNEEANPNIWVEVPGAEIKDGVICVTTTPGVIALMGKP